MPQHSECTSEKSSAQWVVSSKNKHVGQVLEDLCAGFETGVREANVSHKASQIGFVLMRRLRTKAVARVAAFALRWEAGIDPSGHWRIKRLFHPRSGTSLSKSQVEVEIRRSDIALFSLHLLPRDKSNWIFVLVVGVLTFLFLAVTENLTTAHTFGIAIFASVCAGITALLAAFVISLIFVTATASENAGVLGTHTYSVEPDGLREVTKQNETLQKWTGIQTCGKSKRLIWLRITGHLFHIIPRQSFATSHDFNNFWELICRYRDAAETSTDTS
jgi:hypothetical protein